MQTERVSNGPKVAKRQNLGIIGKVLLSCGDKEQADEN